MDLLYGSSLPSCISKYEFCNFVVSHDPLVQKGIAHEIVICIIRFSCMVKIIVVKASLSVLIFPKFISQSYIQETSLRVICEEFLNRKGDG